jgi:Winged helix-turn-helix domain (DUF2582)
MAKTKSTKSQKQRATKPRGGQAHFAPQTPQNEPVPNGVQTATSAPSAARVAGAMSGVEIGHVAGEVWGVLSRNGGATLAALKKEIDAPGDVVVAAIGWLAREDKLEFSTSGRSVKLSLR